MGARSPSPPTSRSSGACAISPPRAPGAPRSASASSSNIASPTMPRSRGASLAISACARTSSTPAATPPSSTSRCSTLARPRDYAGFKPFGALVAHNRVGEYQGLAARGDLGFVAIFTLAAPQASDGLTDIFFARIDARNDDDHTDVDEDHVDED